jgi:hypothetical protein
MQKNEKAKGLFISVNGSIQEKQLIFFKCIISIL